MNEANRSPIFCASASRSVLVGPSATLAARSSMIAWTCSSATSASCTNGPQLDRSDGISVSSSQRPLTWPNRSSCGRTSGSMPSRASSRMLTRSTLVGDRPELPVVQHRYDVTRRPARRRPRRPRRSRRRPARRPLAQRAASSASRRLDGPERVGGQPGLRREVRRRGRGAARTAPAPQRSSTAGRSEPSGQRSPAATTATAAAAGAASHRATARGCAGTRRPRCSPASASAEARSTSRWARAAPPG